MIRKTLVQLSVLPLFALLALGSSSPKKDGAEEKASTTSVTSSKLGTPVTVGDAEWTVLEVVNRGSSMKANDSFTKDATTAGAFIQVRLKVANKGKQEGVFGQAAKLVDPGGREFGTFDDAYSFRPKNTEGLVLEKVQPSMTKEFTEIFEVPAGVTAVSLKAHDFGIFGKDKAINLGNLPPAVAPPPAAGAKPQGTGVAVAAKPQAGVPQAAKPQPSPAAAPAPAAKAKTAPSAK